MLLLDLFHVKHKVEYSLSRSGLHTNTQTFKAIIPKFLPVLSSKSILHKMVVDRECYIWLSTDGTCTCDLTVDRDKMTNLVQRVQQVQEKSSSLFTYIIAMVQQR